MFRTTNMVIGNELITKYKIAMFNNSPQEGICKTCNVPATERHLLGLCKEWQYDTIKRHDIIINEIFKYIIEYKLNGNYSNDRKYIIFPGGFLESGKTIGKVVDNHRINEFKLLKPDIIFKTIDNVLIFDAQICLEKNMQKNFSEKKKQI